MCQLLGMNCNTPTDICFSFTGFQARGGRTDVHKDGWGIAFFEGRGVRQFLDAQPSAHSPVAELVRSYPIHSTNVISHIRKATQGVTALENTHPFTRELWGSYWIFAHNGDVREFQPTLNGAFRPVGSTDSERVFCYILQELRRRFGDHPPAPEDLFPAIRDLATEIGQHGEFNFLLSRGDGIFAHCSTRLSWVARKAPFPVARLKDHDVVVDFSHYTKSQDRVAIIATQPLTENEAWIALEAGTLWYFREGEAAMNAKTVAGVVKVDTTGHCEVSPRRDAAGSGSSS